MLSRFDYDLRKTAPTALLLLVVRQYYLHRGVLSGQFCVSPIDM
jgi:hypothetical protein